MTPRLLLAVPALVLVVVLLVGAWRHRDRSYTGRVRRDVFAVWGPRCAYRWVIPTRCAGGLHVDHQWPHSRGGRTSVTNGQPLCERHNCAKGDRHNWPYVLTHGWPVGGWLIYGVRWGRHEVRGRMR